MTGIIRQFVTVRKVSLPVVQVLVAGDAYGAAIASCADLDPGVIVVEQDVAVDPAVMEDLELHISAERNTLWGVPYRLWPRSTGLDRAVWAHRVRTETGLAFVDAEWPCPQEPAAVGLGCTYLPGPFLREVCAELRSWTYPSVDTSLSAWAREHGWPMRTTTREAVHVHW